MSHEQNTGPYDQDVCHFCGKSDRKNPTESGKHIAGYSRAEDAKPSGPYFNACEACARVPYPQPENLQKGNANV